MSRRPPSFTRLLATAVLSLASAGPGAALRAQSDLDALMRQVLETRDENWKKLQQYVLDERERLEIRGPTGSPIWGERREYAWYIRDGFFVRSPVRINGAPVSEAERQRLEREFLDRETERERRRASAGDREAPASPEAPAHDVDALIRQSRRPQFISSAYFLRFRFEEGHYALVGRETIDGREALKIEYYPSTLFRPTERRRAEPRRADPVESETRRIMNKVSLVTLWIEPSAHQILKYTFDNVSLDFLPSQWFVRLNDVKASMVMGQPFPDVWLPASIDAAVSGMLAVGEFDLRYRVEYHDYRQAETGSKVVMPDGR
jgi:hypothetical protein